MTLAGSRRRTLVAGVALIAITNAAALAGVAWNRSGEPDSVLTLSWRELSNPHESGFREEVGGLVLGLKWRVLSANADDWSHANRHGAPAWLDEAKLAALGFDVSGPPGEREGKAGYERQLPRPVLVVLEFDGPSYRKALEWARQEAEKEAAGTGAKGSRAAGRSAAQELGREEASNSRLFAVDAGLDPAALRAKYPERTRYAIVHGTVRAHYQGKFGRGAKWRGVIEGVENIRINVPNEFRAVIGAVPHSIGWDGGQRGGPPYQVTVMFGKRFEPWITAAAVTR